MQDEGGLDPRWTVWIAENLLEEHAHGDIVAGLVQGGSSVELAQRSVSEMAKSPGFLAAAAATRAVRMASKLRLRQLALSNEITRYPAWNRPTLMQSGTCAQLPLVFDGFARDWPILSWGWKGLLARFADASVTVRLAGDLKELQFPSGRMRFATFEEQLTNPPEGGAPQLVARSGAIEDELGGLLDGTDIESELFRSDQLRVASAWMAAKGTVTPLHYDISDALLIPVLGDKLVTLHPPENVNIAKMSEGFLGPSVDASCPEVLNQMGIEPAGMRQVRLSPGDALFIPTGWWHQVNSLEKSFSLTFAGFSYENNHAWYQPSFATLPKEIDPT